MSDTMSKMRLTLRLDEGLYVRAANLAATDRRSLNATLELLIGMGLEALEPLDGVTGPEPLPGQAQIEAVEGGAAYEVVVPEPRVTPAEERRQVKERDTAKKKARTEMCIHRVAPEAWCKRCDE